MHFQAQSALIFQVSMNQMGIGVFYRITTVVACTLAGARDGYNNFTRESNSTNTCHAPCTSLQARVSVENIIHPFTIAIACWCLMFVPTLLLRSRHKAFAMRALCYPVIFMFVSMWVSYAMYFFLHDRVLAYVWSLHASATGLFTFAPNRALVTQKFFFFFSPLLCLACLCLYARERGPPVGIVPWATREQAQCGWMVHFIAVMGADLLACVMAPIGKAMWAM